MYLDALSLSTTLRAAVVSRVCLSVRPSVFTIRHVRRYMYWTCLSGCKVYVCVCACLNVSFRHCVFCMHN